MSSKSASLANQPQLFETAEIIPRAYNDSRAAFGRIPKGEYFNIDPVNLRAEISDGDIDRVLPNNLRYAVFGESGLSYKGVAFRPDEYEVIVRSPESFAAAIGARTLKASGMDNNLERRAARSERSKDHAFESKLERLSGMISGYNNEQAKLEKLLKEMRSPGYSHMSEPELMMLATTVRELSFRNIIGVAAQKWEWGSDETRRANLALDYNLASEDYRKNFSYWRGMSNLGLQYVVARGALARQNQRHIERRPK